jgi:hypothetical protein
MAKLWGKDSNLYKSRVLGLFPDSDDCTLIPLSSIRTGLQLNDPIKDGKHMGVDIARFGADSNVAVILDNGIVTYAEEWSGIDLMPTTGKIIALMKEHKIKPENIHIDPIGVGAGVCSRLYELNYPIDEVAASTKPVGDWHIYTTDTEFLNRKAELWWAASLLIRTGRIIIPEEFDSIWRDLKDVRYSYDSRGKIKVESKEDLKKRIGRSPDYADSLILALSRMGTEIGIY